MVVFPSITFLSVPNPNIGRGPRTPRDFQKLKVKVKK